MNTAHHITVNGVPYCQEENLNFSHKRRYPTNCGHASREEAEEGVRECRKLRPDLVYKVVEGPCHDDPYWQTEQGKAIRQDEWEMNQWGYDD